MLKNFVSIVYAQVEKKKMHVNGHSQNHIPLMLY